MLSFVGLLLNVSNLTTGPLYECGYRGVLRDLGTCRNDGRLVFAAFLPSFLEVSPCGLVECFAWGLPHGVSGESPRFPVIGFGQSLSLSFAVPVESVWLLMRVCVGSNQWRELPPINFIVFGGDGSP